MMFTERSKAITILFIMAIFIALAISGCGTGEQFCKDVAGTSNWIADKLHNQAEKDKAKNAALVAKMLALYQAEATAAAAMEQRLAKLEE